MSQQQYAILFHKKDGNIINGSSYFNLLYYFGRLMMNLSVSDLQLLYTYIQKCYVSWLFIKYIWHLEVNVIIIILLI